MLALAFICAMTVPVLAKEFRDLVIHKPAAGSTWYKGDKIPMDVETETLDADYLNKFTLKLCPKNSTKTVWTKASPKEEIYYYKTTSAIQIHRSRRLQTYGNAERKVQLGRKRSVS